MATCQNSVDITTEYGRIPCFKDLPPANPNGSMARCRTNMCEGKLGWCIPDMFERPVKHGVNIAVDDNDPPLKPKAENVSEDTCLDLCRGQADCNTVLFDGACQKNEQCENGRCFLITNKLYSEQLEPLPDGNMNVYTIKTSTQ